MNDKPEIDFKSLGFQSKEMHDFPNIINVEVYRGDCVCNCVHCPVGMTPHEEREAVFGKRGIDLKLYTNIVDEVAQHPHSTLRIHSVGEPLLWDNLLTALQISHEQSVRTWLFTCAVTPHTSLLEDLCEQTDVIEVSVNSTTPEDYHATKGVDAFQLVSANIGHMHTAIKNKKLPTRLIVSRVESTNRSADAEFVDYWKSTSFVDDAFVRSYHTYNDLLQGLPSSEIPPTHEPCLVHWARCNISVDGYVVVCFNELFKKPLNPLMILGDVNTQTIADVWQGEKLQALRRAELSRDYVPLSFGKGLPCKDCTSCQPLFGSRQTSEHQIKKYQGCFE